MTTPNFTEIDTDKLRTQALGLVEERTGELLYPGDERRIFTDAVIYAMANFASAVNEQCKARLLPYASGYELDALGERVYCTRLSPAPAHTTLRFTLSTARPNDIIIPAATTVTADNKVLFATDAAATIPAGKLSVEGVTATATIGGTVTNGVPVGAIQSFVDRVPYVTGVYNTTESSGGDAGEPYPRALDPQNGDDGAGDESYRARIRLAPAAYSAAGSKSSYEYYTRTASASVESVSVTSIQHEGKIIVYVTEKGGVQPTEGTLAAVRSALTDDAVRPMNDLVEVSAPEEVEYTLDIDVFVSADSSPSLIDAITGEGGAVEQYTAWQRAEIGRAINPYKLHSLLDGLCEYAAIRSPEYKALQPSQIAKLIGEPRVNIRNLDDLA